MKKFVLLSLIFALTMSATAQNWVTIPDANFANQLNAIVPSCMEGNQLDTTCSELSAIEFMDIGFSEIVDITGIQYFNNLNVLYCDENDLSSLPELPNSLEKLLCGNNLISILPDLPNSLTELSCYGNLLTNLPELPDSLINLYCHWNQLTSLPDLPSSLEELMCQDNYLNSLPELPDSLRTLFCMGNQITCFPPFPQSLLPVGLDEGLNISENPFSCLPNYIEAMGPDLLSVPLCNEVDLENNPYGCIEGITGSVYFDTDGNCEQNSLDSNLINVPLNLIDNEGYVIETTATLNSLYYLFEIGEGEYTVQLQTENKPYQLPCDDPGAFQEVELSVSEPIIQDINFGVECLSNQDIGTHSLISSGWVFPGQEHEVSIAAGDLSNWYGLQCAEGQSGSVTVNITGPVSYVETAENALIPVVSDDIQLTYEIDDFGNIEFEESFGVILETDTAAQTGELICIEVIVEPIDGDANPENNVYTHCYEVVNSYDPNIKQVWPQDVEPGYDGYFNYTIYFQNTGTAPAFNIRVADTLDTNLDLNTFEVTAYSHECLTYVSGNVATFRFNDIMLPDSTSDFDGSIGYVQYRIKPEADLPAGTVIENTAHIFFDFNDAIVTNTTQNEYVVDTSTDHLQKQIATVFPNPGTGQFNVLFSGIETGITTHLEVYNLSGQRVLQQQVNENRMVLDMTGFPSGMYLMHIRNERGSEAVKLMKQ